jgi:predicted transcriptional regulator
MAVTTSIKLDDDLRDRLRAVAKDRQLSVNRLMNGALRDFVERAELRAAFLREAEEAHRDYLETGLHVTQEEMDVWFDAVARGEDSPMPEPHN